MASKPESLPELFESINAKFPASLGPGGWGVGRRAWSLVVATSALISCSNILQLGQFYLYLTKQPEYASLHHRSEFDKRLREFVIRKGINLGTTEVTPFSGTSKEDQPANENIPGSSAQLDAAKYENDATLLEDLYGPGGSANAFAISDAHFKSQSKDVVDRMVADDWVLDAVERQRVTYMAIICEGLLVNSDISMHDASEDLQGMGVSLEETQQMTECGELVARWADVDMRYWPELRIMKHGDREYLLLRHPSLKVDHVREGSRSHA